MSAHTFAVDWGAAPFRVDDPGAGGTINTGNNGFTFVALVTAAAESRTIPAPKRHSERILVVLDTDTGNATVAVTSGQGITSVVLNDAGDAFELVAITVAGTPKWVPAWSSGPLSGLTQTLGGDITVAGTFNVDGASTFDGTAYIGDTANANVTLGLTINQGAADDQALALKSSDVAHAATTLAEADTYGAFAKNVATTGGLMITGFKDADGSVLGGALVLRGVLDETAADTTKSTAATGIVQVIAGIEATNTIGAAGADENLFVITDGAGATQFILDVEGSPHSNAAAATYDTFDDLALVRSYAVDAAGYVKSKWDDYVLANKQLLVDIGVIGKTKGLPGEKPLLNHVRLMQVHNGALWQLFEDVMEIASALPDESKAKLNGRVAKRLELAGA